MTKKEEIMQAIKEKKNIGVWITSISGTNLENNLDSWKYYLCEDRDYDGDTLYCINFYRNRNDKKSSEVTEAYYSSYDKNEVDDKMLCIASKAENALIKFSDKSEMFVV